MDPPGLHGHCHSRLKHTTGLGLSAGLGTGPGNTQRSLAPPERGEKPSVRLKWLTNSQGSVYRTTFVMEVQKNI